MATKKSISMTAVEKKAALASLKLAIKNHDAGVKASVAEFKAAEKAHKEAIKASTALGKTIAADLAAKLLEVKKNSDAATATALKAEEAAMKKLNSDSAKVEKDFAAATAKAEKAKAAAATGATQLASQVALVEAAPLTVPSAPAKGKGKGKAKAAPAAAAAPVAAAE